MPDQIRRSEFLQSFSGTEIDVNELTEQEWQKLESLGVKRSELKSRAGKDGIIRGAEFEALYAYVDDKFDRSGSASTLRLQAENPQTHLVEPTKSGQVYDALRELRRERHTKSLPDFLEEFGQGAFDLRSLTTDQLDELKNLGLNLNKLLSLGDKDRVLWSSAAMKQLFILLDKVDDNGNAQSIDTTLSVSMATPDALAPLTKAGQALDILRSAFKPYEQPFRYYADLTRAAVAGNPPPSVVDLDVKPMTQTEGDNCQATCVEMIEKFDKKKSIPTSNLRDPDYAHNMARAQDDVGSITGSKTEFELGLRYIDNCLDKGRPVLVGGSHSPGAHSANWDKITDHFILITGRGVDKLGQVYYTYVDPGNHEDEFQKNVLYVDFQSMMLFRPPFANAPVLPRYLSKQFQVTQVRPYSDMPFSKYSKVKPDDPNEQGVDAHPAFLR